MQFYPKLNLRLLPISTLPAISLCLFVSIASGQPLNGFSSLQERLIKEGFTKSTIEIIYQNPLVQIDIQTVLLLFKHREAKLDYSQFTMDKYIQKAKKYMEEHRSALDEAQKKFGVDPRVITAILLVETKLGTSIGKKPILNTLSTFSALADLKIRDAVWTELSAVGQTDRKRFDEWADKKSKWAYSELKAYLKYTDREKTDPSLIYGSYAGALGIAQFMPSSILAYAKDGNMDGRIDLFDHDDAVFSIAGYLSHFGWHLEIDRESAYKVIFHYNRSSYYVETILKIRELLKG
jgi:membrane-bound lytic murein transglycosylase B